MNVDGGDELYGPLAGVAGDARTVVVVPSDSTQDDAQTVWGEQDPTVAVVRVPASDVDVDAVRRLARQVRAVHAQCVVAALLPEDATERTAAALGRGLSAAHVLDGVAVCAIGARWSRTDPRASTLATHTDHRLHLDVDPGVEPVDLADDDRARMLALFRDFNDVDPNTEITGVWGGTQLNPRALLRCAPEPHTRPEPEDGWFVPYPPRALRQDTFALLEIAPRTDAPVGETAALALLETIWQSAETLTYPLYFLWQGERSRPLLVAALVMAKAVVHVGPGQVCPPVIVDVDPAGLRLSASEQRLLDDAGVHVVRVRETDDGWAEAAEVDAALSGRR